jgi:hypothetical protein
MIALLPPLCPMAKGKKVMFSFILEVLDGKGTSSFFDLAWLKLRKTRKHRQKCEKAPSSPSHAPPSGLVPMVKASPPALAPASSSGPPPSAPCTVAMGDDTAMAVVDSGLRLVASDGQGKPCSLFWLSFGVPPPLAAFLHTYPLYLDMN